MEQKFIRRRSEATGPARVTVGARCTDRSQRSAWENGRIRDHCLHVESLQFWREELERERERELIALSLAKENCVLCEFQRIGIGERRSDLVRTTPDHSGVTCNSRVHISVGWLHSAAFKYADSFNVALKRNLFSLWPIVAPSGFSKSHYIGIKWAKPTRVLQHVQWYNQGRIFNKVSNIYSKKSSH